jgi:hypothetical protein
MLIDDLSRSDTTPGIPIAYFAYSAQLFHISLHGERFETMRLDPHAETEPS